MTDTRIYVACLAAYNSGRLHGRWIDAEQDADDIRAEIAAMLAESPVAGAEEWAIHDYEGFGSIKLSEYEDIATVAAYASAMAEHGEAFAAFVANDSSQDVEDAVSNFEDAFAGEWPSLEAWAEEYLEDTGQLSEIPDNLRHYFDVEKWARDAEYGGDIWTADAPTGVYVFRSY